MILNALLEFAWARYRLVHMCSWRSHVNGPCYAPNTGFDSPCNTCTVKVEIWVMNVLTIPLHLGHSDLSLATIVFIVFLVHLTAHFGVIGDPVRGFLFAHEQVMETFFFMCLHRTEF